MTTHHSYQHGDAGCSITETESDDHVELFFRWNGPLDTGAEAVEAEKVRNICRLNPNKPTVIRTPTRRILLTEKDGVIDCCPSGSKRGQNVADWKNLSEQELQKTLERTTPSQSGARMNSRIYDLHFNSKNLP